MLDYVHDFLTAMSYFLTPFLPHKKEQIISGMAAWNGTPQRLQVAMFVKIAVPSM